MRGQTKQTPKHSDGWKCKQTLTAAQAAKDNLSNNAKDNVD